MRPTLGSVDSLTVVTLCFTMVLLVGCGTTSQDTGANPDARAPTTSLQPSTSFQLPTSLQSTPTSIPPGLAVVVGRVIDGDTVRLRIAGSEETVRLIGIDTPETHRPNTPVECFGVEASTALERLLPSGSTVWLERDVEARDRYGRLLGYVWLADGRMANEVMAADGYAAPLTYPPNVAYTQRILDASGRARDAERGLWAACGGPHEAAPG